MSLHWIIDTALIREGGYNRLLHALERLGLGYTLVRKPPFADYLVGPVDNDTPITIEVPNPVYATGTTSLGLVSKKYDWTPGYIEGVSQEDLKHVWGDELLNHDALFGEIGTITPPSDYFFARPVEDSKSFTGQVFSRADWEDWTSRLMGIESSEGSLCSMDMVMLAPVKQIYAEYRLFVVGGEIVTGSLYKLGNKVLYKQVLDPAMLDYARVRIKEFCPKRAMCLDIAQIEGESPSYKVIETNSISSAGFYDCDMLRFAGAMNAEFG